MKRALRVLKLEKFFRGRTPGLPSGWTGCRYRPTSVFAVPLDVPSLHQGVTLHFAQSRKERVRIFLVDRLRPLASFLAVDMLACLHLLTMLLRVGHTDADTYVEQFRNAPVVEAVFCVD